MSLQGLVDYHLHTAVTVDAHMSEGVGIEINPKGLKYSVAEIYPSDEFLALYISDLFHLWPSEAPSGDIPGGDSAGWCQPGPVSLRG